MRGSVGLAILIITAICACNSLAAQANYGSFQQLWNNSNLPDSTRLDAVQRIAFGYVNTQPDSARLMALMQLEYARAHGLPAWQARALNVIGLSYRFQSDYQRALQHYEQSIALLEKSGDRNYMSAVYGNMGDLFRLQNNYPKAIDYITRALALAEETGDHKRTADAYVSIATIYFENPSESEKVFEYLEKARKIYEQMQNQQGLALVFSNLSAAHVNKEEYDKALIYNDKALSIHEMTGDVFGVATSLHNRAIIHTYQGRYHQAMDDFNREVGIFQSLGDKEGLADAYNSMGELWIQQGRFAQAVKMCGQALGIARKISSPPRTVADACDCLYRAHYELGQYKTALEYLEMFIAAKDGLEKEKTAQRLKEMEVQRQMAIDSLARVQEKFRLETAHQQALRRKNNLVWMLLIGALGTAVIALGFWVRMLYFRKRSQMLKTRSDELEKKQLLNEIELLRSQVNPHFLFNSLSILSSLVHVDTQLAEQFIEQLSRSYRYILEQKEQSLVTLRTELEFIQAYAFLLKIRFEDKFDLAVDIPERMLDTGQIAPLTLQLLIENAVKHNRMSTQEPLKVRVFVENGPTLVVQNNLQPRTARTMSTGVGLPNIQNRYALLTEKGVSAGENGDSYIVKVPLL